ncbi:MAG: formylmethanofuran dehydrogenase subunit B [Candidatus Lokiarchaeota archaeon]|nr:formylmethanofuran dehydrogenase subunit B [Candidatus Lokiarchaeota archaeon]
MKRIPCTGCSLLCDDIIVRTDGIYIDEIVGACLKGKERFDLVSSKNRITSPMIKENGSLISVPLEKAVENALKIIKSASKPLLYGFSNSSCEAQSAGITLARLLDAFIDSNSMICQGKTLKEASNSGIIFTTLSEVINKADLLILWGFNAAESIPRLLNKTLFSRGKFRMTGREIKTLIIVDPVKTASFGVMGVRDLSLMITPGMDLALIKTLKEECCSENSIPNEGVAGLDQDDLKRLLLNLREAENGVVFLGQGILRDPKGDQILKEILELIELINQKQQKGRISIIMGSGHYNMNGFDQVALSIAGRNRNLQFNNHELKESDETIVTKIHNADFDCSIIVGTDPISHLPQELSSKLASRPIILIDNKNTPTAHLADVIFPTSITGIESEGLAFRLDNVPVNLKRIVNPPNNLPSDKELLEMLINRLGGN